MTHPTTQVEWDLAWPAAQAFPTVHRSQAIRVRSLDRPTRESPNLDLRPDSLSGWSDSLERDGYAILDRILSPVHVTELIEATRMYASGDHDGRLDRGGEVYGGRDLLWRIAEVRRLAQSPALTTIAETVLGPGAFAVRGLFFDKTPTANWNLPWHQDLTIALRARRDVPGFGPWTLKGGIPHVHAPAELLARMLTIRLHLDDCGPERA